MKLSHRVAGFAALAAISLTTLTPIAASADGNKWWQHKSYSQSENQQENKNNWRNLAIGAGALAVVGLLNHNKTLTAIGAAGAAYSADRYEKDRQSQSDDSWGHGRRDYHRWDGNRGDRYDNGYRRDSDRSDYSRWNDNHRDWDRR